MGMTNASKQEIVGFLLATKQKGHAIETSLRFKGRADEADQLSKKSDLLSEKIDRLLVQMTDEWIGETDEICAEITQANDALQRAIREIENDLQVAENVVKAIGFVDDVIVIASKIAAAAS